MTKLIRGIAGELLSFSRLHCEGSLADALAMLLMSTTKAVQSVNLCEHCMLYQHQLQCSLLYNTMAASQKLL